MAKDKIFDNAPPKPKKSEGNHHDINVIERFFNQFERFPYKKRKKHSLNNPLFHEFKETEFKPGDLVKIPTGAILEYGDVYYDLENKVYIMTKRTGEEANSARQYYRQSANMPNLDQDAAFEFYAG